MKRYTLSAVATVMVCFCSTTAAQAQCNFDAPGKSKPMKLSFVRAFEECTSADPWVPCSPPVPLSSYEFGPKGGCSIKVQAKLLENCPSFNPEPCQEYTFKGLCRDIRNADGSPIDAGTGATTWQIQLKGRGTSNGGSGSDATYQDTGSDPGNPWNLPSETPKGGSVKWKYSPCKMFPCSMPPGCSSSEILKIELVDPDGNTFAVPGWSTR